MSSGGWLADGGGVVLALTRLNSHEPRGGAWNFKSFAGGGFTDLEPAAMTYGDT